MTTIDHGIKTMTEKSNLTDSPRYLRKEIKRLTKSRNEFKARNKEKYLEVKKLNGRAKELCDSRRHWKDQAMELEDDKQKLEAKLKKSEIEAEQERQRNAKLLFEIEQLKKKLAI